MQRALLALSEKVMWVHVMRVAPGPLLLPGDIFNFSEKS